MAGFTDFIANNAGDLIKAGVQLYTTSQTNSANREAARDNAALSGDAAGIINSGYDAQLAELLGGSDTVAKLYGQGFDASTNWLTDNNDRYTQALAQALGGYGGGVQAGTTGFQGTMTDADQQFGASMAGGANTYAGSLGGIGNTYSNEMGGAVDEYGNIIDTGYNGAIGVLEGGADQFQGQYQPYQQAGTAALGQLQQTMAQDPGTWTPEQARLIDQYRRNAGATLAHSGLRGAGRAGIAAVNEGEAALAAKLYAQNQARSDAATDSLARYGYGSTGAVAGNIQGNANSTANLIQRGTDAVGNAGLAAAKQVADMRSGLLQKGTAAQFENSNLAAGNTMKTNAGNAANQYAAQQDLNSKALAANETTASRTGTTGNAIADMISRYYGNLTNLAGQDATATANTALNKSVTSAGAKTAGGQGLINSALANTSNWGTSLGSLSSIIAADMKDQTARASAYQQPIVWDTTKRTDGSTGPAVTWGNF